MEISLQNKQTSIRQQLISNIDKDFEDKLLEFSSRMDELWMLFDNNLEVEVVDLRLNEALQFVFDINIKRAEEDYSKSFEALQYGDLVKFLKQEFNKGDK